MEDIIEEIVGEIRDEYDDEKRTYLQIDDHTFIFEGKTLLSDFYTVTHLPNDTFDDVRGDADTVAGLVLELKGEFPKVREEVEHKDFRFQVLSMDARRITKVKLFIKLLIPFLFIAFSSCNSGRGKQQASVRTYQQITDTLPFTFQIPTSAKLIMSAAPTDSTYFFDIIFPKEKARLYVTYHRLVFGKAISQLKDSVSIRKRFWKLSEESRRLVYFHSVKADAIHEEEYEDSVRHIGGLFYDLTGAVATPVQLSLTDSSTYFLHASLYFDSGEMRPEKAGTLSVLKLDLRHLMETFTHSY